MKTERAAGNGRVPVSFKRWKRVQQVIGILLNAMLAEGMTWELSTRFNPPSLVSPSGIPLATIKDRVITLKIYASKPKKKIKKPSPKP